MKLVKMLCWILESDVKAFTSYMIKTYITLALENPDNSNSGNSASVEGGVRENSNYSLVSNFSETFQLKLKRTF